MKVVGLIPARGGSKGIPRKNIKPIAGKPLIAWTIESALDSKLLDSVVVSTEDNEIAKVARECGAQVPFMRPSDLAQDNTPGIEPVLHAMQMLPEYDAVILLQPTSPLRNTEDIDAIIKLSQNHQAPSVVSVSEPAKHPYWMYQVDDNNRLQTLINVPPVSNRQELPQVYVLNGALYYARTNWLKENCTFVTSETLAYVMPVERSIDVDTLMDWKLAELLLNEKS